jgi:hypothetical protein
VSISRTADIFDDWGDMRKTTYIGGFGQAEKPLLEAIEFVGNRNGLGQYNFSIRVA